MSTISIREQIKNLVELQTVDAEIYRFKKELKEKPVFIEELKKKFEDKKSRLQALEEQLKTVQVHRKGLELEIQSKDADIAKANGQLMSLKTNKEYQAKLSEIENIKADKSLVEEKIILSYDESDAISADIGKEKKVLAEEEHKYLSEKKKADGDILVIEEQMKTLENKRHQIIPVIDKTNLSRYERVLVNKEGLAMVPIRMNTCGGCFMGVPAQVINEIKMHDKLITCEMCSRLLYLEDDL